jgi:anti-sigma factor (TIGR02949 family)
MVAQTLAAFPAGTFNLPQGARPWFSGGAFTESTQELEPNRARRIQQAVPQVRANRPVNHEDRVKCSDVINQLSDYLDAEAAQDLCASLESHLADCPNCRVYIDTVKKTISLYRSESSLECPEQVRTRLHTTLSYEYRKK